MRKEYLPLLLIIAGFIIFPTNCILDRDKTPIPSREEVLFPPFLKIINVTDVTDSSAVLEVEIEKDWGFPVTRYGACWYESSVAEHVQMEPTLNQNMVKQTSHTGEISKNFKTGLRHLKKETSYDVRAYAFNFRGIGYSQLVSFNTLNNASKSINSIIDVEGNVYSIVTVGSQKWTKENLRTTHYRNGNKIFYQKENWSQINYTAYRWPEDDSTKATAGVFYNWYAATEATLPPYGWHIPTAADYNQLMKAPGYQQLLNLNEAPIALTDGLFNGWWSTDNTGLNPYCLYFLGNNLILGKEIYNRSAGLFLRCVKN
jgi:uncharacterized protein (TIGR02145 family)